MKIYVSHSIADSDRPLLDAVVRVAGDFGLTVIVGRRPWLSETAIPPEVAEAVDSCEFALFWLTASGPDLQCVNLEAGYIRNSSRRVPFLIFAPENVAPSGCLQYRPFVRFNSDDARITVGQIWDFLHHEYQERPLESAAIKGFLLSLTGMMLMRYAVKSPPPTELQRRDGKMRQAAAALLSQEKR